MEYKFEMPHQLKADTDICKHWRGGACPEKDLIYLYGWGKETEYEDKIWAGIITHEHLHNILYKHGISAFRHHEIISRMKPYIFSFKL